jgi:hypothetical protein
MKRTALGVVLFACIVLILAPAVVAQQTNGIIQGAVSDAAGALVAGASVTVVNDSTGYTRDTTSGTDGSYAFTELPPGHYHVTVKKEGFKAETQKDVELHVGSTVVLNVKLTVGSVSESLTIEANPIAVETTTAALGNITEGAQVRELPLNGLNFIGLALLVPGASTMDGFSASTKGVLGGSDIVFSGGQRTGNVFTVDNAPNNDMGSQRTILAYPSLDAISEVKTVTNAYGPEYGQSGGGQVNIVTKSGTNGFHGSLYYFGRNDALNANNWFNTNTTPAIPKGELRRNDFGFSIGGPIKKDKLFFFFSQEFNREIDGDLHTGQTPSAAELSGDFSGATTGGHLTNCYFNANAPQFGIIDFPVIDPATGKQFGPTSNPNYIQNISQTPEGLSPAGSLIAHLYPASNVTPTAANPCPNPDYKQILKSAVNLWQSFGRLDYNVNKSTTLMLTYTQSHWSQPAPSLPGGEWGDTGFPAVDSSWAQPSRIAAIRLSRTIGNTAVNDFQFSYSGNRINITNGGTNPGLSQQIYAAMTPDFPLSGKTGGANLAPPVFWGPGGYSTLWNAAPWSNRMDRYTWTDDYSKVAGKHQLKFGALLAHNVKDQPNNGDFNESPALWGNAVTCATGDNCSFAGGPWGGAFAGTTAGNGIANMLLKGTVYGFGESSNLHNATGRYQDYEFYGGDTFRATRRLTVNYGFRWSLLMQPYAADNELAFFNPNQFNPTVPNGSACDGLIAAPGSKVTCANVSGGALPGSATASNRSIVANSYHNIAPRLGVAWDLFGDGKTSIRAGVGQFFVRYQLDPFIIQGTQNPPYIQQANGSGYRYLDGTVASNEAGIGYGHPGFGRTLNADIPNNWQWNLSISRELFRNNTMQVSYVGNRGNHLQDYTDVSQITPMPGNPISATGAQNVCGAPYGPGGSLVALGQAVPVGDTCRQGFAITNINATGNGNSGWRPYLSYFGQATAGDAQLPVADFGGYSTYHSLQATWRGRIDSRGSIYQFSYTWSKALALQGVQGLIGQGATDVFSDNLDPHHDYGPTGFDRRQIFSGSVVYALPLLKGANAFERTVLGGWSIDPVVVMETGVPVAPTTGQDLWGTGTNQDRPNRVRGQPCRASGSGIESQWINPNAFSLYGLPLGTDGTASLGDCYGPGENNWDIALHKDFKINERLKVQFRFEFFNAFNKTQFEGVNGGLGGAQICFGDSNGNFVPVNAPVPSTSTSPLVNDHCYLTGNPLGQVQTIPTGATGAYQIIPGPGGVSSTLLSTNSISQSGFGQATFTRPPRQIQYALRFTF